MWASTESDLTVVNFYDMSPPDPKYMRERMKKVNAVIASMGDKYRLAKSIERKAEPLPK